MSGKEHPWGKRYPRIKSIHLNRWERPLRATVWTKYGIVKVLWKDVGEDRCWFASGKEEAKQEAVAAIEHIEQMCLSIHWPPSAWAKKVCLHVGQAFFS